MSEREPHPMTESLLHRVLVATDAAQRLPNALIAALLIAAAGITALSWVDQGAGLLVGIGMGAAGGVSWLMLWLLPRRGKSFGGEKASALGLIAAHALVTLALGWLNVDVPLAFVFMALIAALAFYATWIEPFQLGLSHEVLQAAGWHTPIKLLHLSDLHLERITVRERKLNRMIHLLKPDLIVFTGDFVNLSYNHDARAEADIRAIIGEWSAPLGVYCVPGTPVVESLDRVRAFTAGLDNLTLLLNDWRTLQTPGGALHLLGVVTTHDLPTDRAALDDAMQAAPADGFRLLLAHSPDIAPEAASAGFNLMLCGHTHGGQIRFPVIGALLSSSQLGLRYVMGRYAVGRMTLYVSRGIGMEGYGAPRARFLCPPEAILWRIT